jgi:hypothetical protein
MYVSNRYLGVSPETNLRLYSIWAAWDGKIDSHFKIDPCL